MRDWRSGIVTVTVRDSRHREHDPILGVVPLRLSEILQTSSQVTRWYPLDGGIGFGRVRISLLFRSIETKLPPQMLGWDVGTFEFTSPRILALNCTKITNSQVKLKLRTGGSTGRVSRSLCHKTEEGDGYYWDIGSEESKAAIRLPVKYRYRSPVVFEFHVGGKRGAVAYAQIWLQHLVDNEDIAIDIPIWTTKMGSRLTQNYVTERNWKAKEVPGLEDLEEVGRLQFRCCFKPGIDESHERFVIDNDSRETFETWEACWSEGVRQRYVEAEVPERTQSMHEKSLIEGRDILTEVPEKADSGSDVDKTKWTSKSGEDWSGAFGMDPKAFTDSRGRKIAEPGRDKPPHDPYLPSDDEDNEPDYQSDSSSDLGIADADNRRSMSSSHASRPDSSSITSESLGRSSTESTQSGNKANKKSEHRKQRGLMQWKPARNAAFAKDEALFAARRIKNKFAGGLSGREPGVETEA